MQRIQALISHMSRPNAFVAGEEIVAARGPIARVGVLACSSDNSGGSNNATGGSAANANTGGAATSGGLSSAGGMVPVGGATNTGDMMATGGMSNAGGMMAAGGMSGTMTFKLRIENTSTNSALPTLLAPGVFAVVNDASKPFTTDIVASAGLEKAAKDANPSVLAMEIMGAQGVASSGIFRHRSNGVWSVIAHGWDAIDSNSKCLGRRERVSHGQ